MENRSKGVSGEPYVWGKTDCFSVLNLVYHHAGLELLERDVVLDVLGDDRHASRSQIEKILKELTVPLNDFQNGSIMILTANDVCFGTGLLINGNVLFSSEPTVRLAKRCAIRKAVRILGCYKPKNH